MKKNTAKKLQKSQLKKEVPLSPPDYRLREQIRQYAWIDGTYSTLVARGTAFVDGKLCRIVIGDLSPAEITECTASRAAIENKLNLEAEARFGMDSLATDAGRIAWLSHIESRLWTLEELERAKQ